MLVQRCGLAPGDLGVISPYAAQVSLLSRQLQERGYTINARGGSSDQEDEGVGAQLRNSRFAQMHLAHKCFWCSSQLQIICDC
jgi:hypothetical protein